MVSSKTNNKVKMIIAKIWHRIKRVARKLWQKLKPKRKTDLPIEYVTEVPRHGNSS